MGRYRDNWDASRKRFEAFWHQELTDRCCIHITAPIDPHKELPRIVDDEAYRTDPEAIIRFRRALMANTYYCGDAFPCMPLDLGAAGHAAFFKGEKHAIAGTVWFFPSLEDPDDLKFNEESFLLKKTFELAKAFAEDSQGDYFISQPDTSGNADALAHLMGSENLLAEMIENPEGVERALAKIQQAYEYTMRRAFDIIKETNRGGGCIEWLNLWAPGFSAQMQSDMCVMISNPMFKRFILPEVQAQSRFLEYPLYHFDGIEQRRHLDTLLSVPGLKVIQWTQVVGQPPCTDYMDDLKKIQAAGKSLLISVTPDQIPPLMEQLSSKGLYLLTNAPSADDADAIEKAVRRLTHD